MSQEYFATVRYNLVNIGWFCTMLLALRPDTLTARFFGLPIFTGPARLAYSMYLWHLVLGAMGVLLIMPKGLEGHETGVSTSHR